MGSLSRQTISKPFRGRKVSCDLSVAAMIPQQIALSNLLQGQILNQHERSLDTNRWMTHRSTHSSWAGSNLAPGDSVGLAPGDLIRPGTEQDALTLTAPTATCKSLMFVS